MDSIIIVYSVNKTACFAGIIVGRNLSRDVFGQMERNCFYVSCISRKYSITLIYILYIMDS